MIPESERINTCNWIWNRRNYTCSRNFPSSRKVEIRIMGHRYVYIQIALFISLFAFPACKKVVERNELTLTLLNGLTPRNVSLPSISVGRSGRIQVSSLSLTIRAPNQTGFSARLSSQPLQNVTISLGFDTTKIRINGSAVTPFVLTFTPANFDTIQTVQITRLDTIADTSSIAVTSASTDTTFDGESTSITLNLTSQTISYPNSTYTFYALGSIGTISPALSTTTSTCASTPGLPGGLSILNTTCAISGTPLSTQASTSYTITMLAGPPTITTTIQIEVLQGIRYSANSFIFKQNDPVPTMTPIVLFTPTSCSVTPALPAGLTLNTTNCQITGTPTGTQAATSYTISMTNGTSNAGVQISIRIEAVVYKVFVSASTYDGNLGGAAGADAKCNADANKPSTGTYKAMITDDTRRACSSSSNCTSAAENIDWVFQSGRLYIRSSDSARLLSPNTAGILPANVSNAFTNPFTLDHPFDSGPAKLYWTGMAFTNFWNLATVGSNPNAFTCENWTSNANIPDGGRAGISNSTSYTAIRSGSGRNCNESLHLLCVEH